MALPAKYIGEAKMMLDTTLDSEIATNEVIIYAPNNATGLISLY